MNFVDLIGLNRRDRLTLLKALDVAGARRSAAAEHLRADQRHEYQAVRMPIVVAQADGSMRGFLVCARDLSAGGLAFIHGGFIHTGTRCQVLLATRGGQRASIRATIRRCRHLRDRIHEIGAQFDEPVNPADFVLIDEDQLEAMEQAAAAPVADASDIA